MRMKVVGIILSLVVVATIVYLGYERMCASRSLQSPLPNRWASINRNYDAVSIDVKRHFPKIRETTQYTWENGYLMGFQVKHATTSSVQAREIVSYAYPKWVQIRLWSGMSPQGARDCKVHVFDDWGIELVE